MTEYLASTYGDRIAEHYDALHATVDPAAIDLLTELAGSGPVLELGIGNLSLAHRWADWKRQPFRAGSSFHISVYRREPA